jgi:hypothetical protein
MLWKAFNMTAVVLSVAACFFLLQPSFASDGYRTTNTMKWGRYTVVQKIYTGDTLGAELEILSPKGKILRLLSGDVVERVSLVPLKNGMEPALLVWTRMHFSQGGGPCNFLFVQRHHRIHNVAIIVGGFADPVWPGRAGYPNLLIDTDFLFLDLDFYNCSFDAEVVFAWNGHCYEQAEKQYPGYSLSQSKLDKKAFRQDLRQTDPDYTEIAEVDLQSYYINLALIGRANEAKRWVMRHTQKSMRTMFLKYKPRLDNQVDGRMSDTAQSDQKYYHFNDIYWAIAYNCVETN